MRRLLLLAAAATLCVSAAAGPPKGGLDTYLKKPEPAYRWEKRGEQEIEGCKVYDLHLVSQVWQGITWEHRLLLYRPANLEHPEFCALYNTGGSGSEANNQQALRLAKSTGCLYAILYNIPNQPL